MNTFITIVILFLVGGFILGSLFMSYFLRDKDPRLPSHDIDIRAGLYKVISAKRVCSANGRHGELHFILVLIGQSSLPLTGEERLYILSEMGVYQPKLYSQIPEEVKDARRNTLKVTFVGGVKTVEYFGPKTFELFESNFN